MASKAPSTPERTVLCLQWGDYYGPDWTNRLYRGVARNLQPPFRFVCFTDRPEGLEKAIEVRDIQTLSLGPELNDIWWKLAVLHPKAGLSGRCLFLDLDSVILGDLAPFFEHDGLFCIIRNWIARRKTILRPRPLIGNSSVFRFEAGAHPQVAELFLKDPDRARNRRFFPTEQAFMTHGVGLQNITWWPDPWVRSFKHHCRPLFPLNWFRRPRLPTDARILTFHGRPKPQQVIAGYSPGSPRKKLLPMPELTQYWS